jgi:hypothetical protein
VKTITSYFLANKKSHSCWLFGFMGRKMALSIGKSTTSQSHFFTHKSNANTTDFNIKLLKQLRSSYEKKYSC